MHDERFSRNAMVLIWGLILAACIGLWGTIVLAAYLIFG